MAISIYFSSLSMKPGDIISIPFAFMADKDDEVFLMLTSNFSFSFSSSSSSSYFWLGMCSSSKLVGSKMTSIKWKWDNSSLESSVLCVSFCLCLSCDAPKDRLHSNFIYIISKFWEMYYITNGLESHWTHSQAQHTHSSFLAVNLVSKYGYAINIRILERTLEC